MINGMKQINKLMKSNLVKSKINNESNDEFNIHPKNDYSEIEDKVYSFLKNESKNKDLDMVSFAKIEKAFENYELTKMKIFVILNALEYSWIQDDKQDFQILI